MTFKTNALLLALILGAVASAADAGPSLAPSVSSADDADKTIFIKEGTHHVNVFANETVLFNVGDQHFAIKFDGISKAYDLAKLAPAGVLNHKVRVYVAPSPTDREQGSP